MNYNTFVNLCVKCGTPLDGIQKFCQKCGTPCASVSKNKCIKCGMPLDDIQKFCQKCGTPVNATVNLQPNNHVQQNELVQKNNTDKAENIFLNQESQEFCRSLDDKSTTSESIIKKVRSTPTELEQRKLDASENNLNQCTQCGNRSNLQICWVVCGTRALWCKSKELGSPGKWANGNIKFWEIPVCACCQLKAYLYLLTTRIKTNRGLLIALPILIVFGFLFTLPSRYVTPEEVDIFIELAFGLGVVIIIGSLIGIPYNLIQYIKNVKLRKSVENSNAITEDRIESAFEGEAVRIIDVLEGKGKVNNQNVFGYYELPSTIPLPGYPCAQSIHHSIVSIAHTRLEAENKVPAEWKTTNFAKECRKYQQQEKTAIVAGGITQTDKKETISEIKSDTLQSIKAISAGFDHTVIVKTDGSLWTCGNNECCQLGTGTTDDRHTPKMILESGVNIAVACVHTLVVKTDGSLWAWGNNEYGQIGDGTQAERNIPTKIISEGIQTVAAGLLHSLAIRTDGSLWAWGCNNNGQLGDGTLKDSLTPKLIINSGVKAIAAGNLHSVALKTDGSLWAWGNNEYGQIGDGTQTDRKIPTQIEIGDIIAIAAGLHTLAIKTDNSLWAWGNNKYGQLGIDNRSTLFCATPKQTLEYGVKEIKAGPAHSIAIATDGSCWTWGNNENGQLGDGTITNSYMPRQIITDDVMDIAAGGEFTLALKTDGSLWAWGNNEYGQFGNGESDNKSMMPNQII